MRFWHVDLLEFLPRQQLVNQWREVCQVAKNMALNGTTGNVLTERVMDYPPEHLQAYAEAVMNEMERQDFRCNPREFTKWQQVPESIELPEEVFPEWFTRRYLLQNLYELQELFDCKAFSAEEWMELDELMAEVLAEIYEEMAAGGAE